MKSLLVFIGAAVRRVGSGNPFCGTGLVKCASWIAAVLLAAILSAATVTTASAATAEEVLAQ